MHISLFTTKNGRGVAGAFEINMSSFVYGVTYSALSPDVIATMLVDQKHCQ